MDWCRFLLQIFVSYVCLIDKRETDWGPPVEVLIGPPTSLPQGGGGEAQLGEGLRFEI